MSDLPRLLELLLEMQEKSKYAGDVEVDQAVARSLLLDGVRRNGGLHDGGTIFLVIDVAGKIEAFILGILNRVYLIGNRLQANDLFLYCTQAAPRTAAARLVEGYVAWAMANPKVAKVALSWTDALGQGNGRIARLYAKKGFNRVGEIWERDGA